MEEGIKSLYDSLNNKYEELITIQARCNDLNFKIHGEGITLNPKYTYKAGLTLFSIYNSLRNINGENNMFYYNKEKIQFTFGAYEIKEINNVIASHFKSDLENSPIIFEPQISLNKVKMIIKKGNSVDFTKEKTFRKLLGFESKVYKEGKHIAENIANIQNDINSINVKCNFIQGNYYKNLKNTTAKQENIIFCMPSFTVGFGQKIIQQPYIPIYFPVNTYKIQHVILDIVDGNGKKLDFGNEEAFIQIHIKQI